VILTSPLLLSMSPSVIWMLRVPNLLREVSQKLWKPFRLIPLSKSPQLLLKKGIVAISPPVWVRRLPPAVSQASQLLGNFPHPQLPGLKHRRRFLPCPVWIWNDRCRSRLPVPEADPVGKIEGASHLPAQALRFWMGAGLSASAMDVPLKTKTPENKDT
jgi:hypothetical protein